MHEIPVGVLCKTLKRHRTASRMQRLCYGAAATWTKASGVTIALYAMTMGRRYALRRLFET